MRKAAARGHLRLFGQYVTPAWDWTPRHWKLIAQKLMAVERGEIKRLMMFTPPRHGKSELSTIHFPAWFLLRNPDKRVITVSYSADLAKTFSRRTRAIVREFGPELFGVELSDESSSAEQWALKGHHGMYIAAGVGGPITGQGASLLIIDDPIKNAEEANSPTYRQKVWDWWTSTAYTRLEPDGAVVITLTRWNQDDLAGRILAEMREGGEQWEVIRLPAICEDADDPLGREIGEPLWPERYGLDELERIRKAVGLYVWNALYQQRPMDVEGGVFKAHWFKWYTWNEIFQDEDGNLYYHDEPLTIYGGVDPAISERDSADEFVFVTVGFRPNGECLVLDVVNGHFEPNEQANLVVRQYEKWRHKRIGIEINGGQRYLYEQVKGRVPAKQLNHRTDKYSRLANMAPDAENGLIWLREALDNEGAFVDEVRLPGRRIHHSMQALYEQMVTYTATAAHDDRIDALENAWSLERTGKSMLIRPGGGKTLAQAITPVPGDEDVLQVEGTVPVVAQPGMMLPEPVQSKLTLAQRRASKKPTCPECGKEPTMQRGFQYHCPEHGWWSMDPETVAAKARAKMTGKPWL